MFDVIAQAADALCSAGDHFEISVSKVHSFGYFSGRRYTIDSVKKGTVEISRKLKF